MVIWGGGRCGTPPACVMHWLCDLAANERKQGGSASASLPRRSFIGIKEEWGQQKRAARLGKCGCMKAMAAGCLVFGSRSDQQIDSKLLLRGCFFVTAVLQ